ncbi:T7SS effector LXG polymorphic toxin [Enterococcus ureasiticus]
MGLKFYVSEAQARSVQASQLTNQANQAITSLQASIQLFLSAPLSSKAYDSAKNYFMVAYTPLCQSAIMTGEALESAHKKFLSEYQGTVSGIDTDEDLILEEINQFEQLKQRLDHQMSTAKTPRPDLERRYINACESIDKRREKLEKFHTYDGQSASFFSDYEASQQEFNTGLAQVANSKAWNPATGTFDLKRLDMTWAKPIHTRWKQREKMKQQVKDARVKQAIGKLNGYEIVKIELGYWYLMKDGKIVSPDKYPELYEQLEKCKDYLNKDQYKVEELKVMKNEMPLAPGFGGILGNLGKAGKIADVIKKGSGVLKAGQSISDIINNAPTINAMDETADLDKSRESGEPAKKHKELEVGERRLESTGEPNSSTDLLNPDGSVKRRRYYGPDGKAVEDIDYNHTDDGTHEFPHRHQWDWNKVPPRQ